MLQNTCFSHSSICRRRTRPVSQIRTPFLIGFSPGPERPSLAAPDKQHVAAITDAARAYSRVAGVDLELSWSSYAFRRAGERLA